MSWSACAEFGNGEVGPALGLGHFEGRGLPQVPQGQRASHQEADELVIRHQCRTPGNEVTRYRAISTELHIMRRWIAIRDAQVRVPPPGLRVWVNSDSEMQRFESSRPNQPVRLKRVKYNSRSKTAPHREVSQI